MSAANKAIMRRVIEEGMNRHDLSLFTELYSHCVYRSPAVGELRGEAWKRFLASVLSAFPDLRQAIKDQLADGDNVVTRWSITATHQGEFMGIAPNGKEVTFTGICIDRIVDGKIMEEWEEWDALGLLRQVGAIPTTVAAKAARNARTKYHTLRAVRRRTALFVTKKLPGTFPLTPAWTAGVECCRSEDARSNLLIPHRTEQLQ